jgi:hypothetical protein
MPLPIGPLSDPANSVEGVSFWTLEQRFAHASTLVVALGWKV